MLRRLIFFKNKLNSLHEIGIYDIPAMVDYIISKTKSTRVHYVGMSQGSAAFLAMLSLMPEYNNKIISAHLLAPVTTFYPTESIVLKGLAFFNYIIEVIIKIELNIIHNTETIFFLRKFWNILNILNYLEKESSKRG